MKAYRSDYSNDFTKYILENYSLAIDWANQISDFFFTSLMNFSENFLNHLKYLEKIWNERSFLIVFFVFHRFIVSNAMSSQIEQFSGEMPVFSESFFDTALKIKAFKTYSLKRSGISLCKQYII